MSSTNDANKIEMIGLAFFEMDAMSKKQIFHKCNEMLCLVIAPDRAFLVVSGMRDMSGSSS